MYKIIKLFIIFFFFFVFSHISFSACEYDWDINSSLENCFNTGSNLVNPWNLEISSWFKDLIFKWIKYLGGFLSLVAVWSIVYWAFMFTISTWDDEKIKKAKDIIKWWILWFLVIISSWAIITIVIEVFYDLV